MNQRSSNPQSGRPGTTAGVFDRLRARPSLHRGPGCHVAWLRIAFSGRYRHPHEEVDQRLHAALIGSGLDCLVMERNVLLLGQQRVITPPDWTWVVGWLLCQPEVVFVARTEPLTRSNHEQAQ